MKKVFAFFTVVFSFVLLLMSCSTKGGILLVLLQFLVRLIQLIIQLHLMN